MKKMTLISMALILLTGLTSFAGTNTQTIENLKAAFKGETTASAKYAAFAEQARKEGLTQIATMFEATSRAEQIHAANHQTVLEKLGQKAEPVKPGFAVKSTKENLEDAIKGESYEMTTMYPGFIATAKTEEVAPAAKSFRWAMDTEKKHQVMYQNALNALNSKKTDTLSKVYWVCPKCGNTYDSAKPEASCAFCSTKREKYIKFGK
ncbi:MAG: rubrerythrin family protein [Bacteroidales bacterium]